MLPVNFYGRVEKTSKGSKWVDTQASEFILIKILLFLNKCFVTKYHKLILFGIIIFCRLFLQCHMTVLCQDSGIMLSILYVCGQLNLQIVLISDFVSIYIFSLFFLQEEFGCVIMNTYFSTYNKLKIV